jgi:hypothetical protein
LNSHPGEVELGGVREERTRPVRERDRQVHAPSSNLGPGHQGEHSQFLRLVGPKRVRHTFVGRACKQNNRASGDRSPEDLGGGPGKPVPPTRGDVEERCLTAVPGKHETVPSLATLRVALV